ncbi:hypothetical protein KFK09_021153 [Dendrobium nobile]|uniref:Uncharacterized protein n=1 Tax=Dendrobium nobile TaxID=94219 RepID=A0A8T3AV17_DENNO|nr:hypothetical protein KFK09_021153 [Dendrobium nobile]
MRYFEEREKAEEREKRRKKWKSGFSDDAELFSSEVAVEEIAVHESTGFFCEIGIYLCSRIKVLKCDYLYSVRIRLVVCCFAELLSSPLLSGGFQVLGRARKSRTSSADLRDLADEARSREKDSYLHSERAPVVTSDPTGRTVSTCRAFRSDGKETSPKEPNKQIVAAKSNSSEGAEEATHAKLHLTRSNESKWR